MNPNEAIKVIELRNYLIKPAMRERFIEHFQKNFVESQNVSGGFVLGAFRVENQPDRFFWMRGFADMNARSRFLPAFYGGEVWRKFGPAANEMMLEWHDVYLLKPLEEIKIGDFLTEKSLTVIEFYFAKNGAANELGEFFKNQKSDATFWTGEMTENDFPRLPVIQNENLLAAISEYADETEYEAKRISLPRETGGLTAKRERVILRRAF